MSATVQDALFTCEQAVNHADVLACIYVGVVIALPKFVKVICSATSPSSCFDGIPAALRLLWPVLISAVMVCKRLLALLYDVCKAACRVDKVILRFAGVFMRAPCTK